MKATAYPTTTARATTATRARTKPSRQVAPARIEAPAPVPSSGALAPIAAAVATGAQVLTLIFVLLTVAAMIVAGPFGFVPALAVGPLFLVGGLFEWLSERLSSKPEVAEPEDLIEDLSDDLHAALPTWLAQIEREGDPARLDNLLGWFEVALEEHFVQEEETGGLFEHLREMDPRMIGPVAMLEREHDEIRSLLSETRRQCGERSRYRTSKRLLLTTIRAHQQAEDALFQEAYGIEVTGLPFVG